MLGESAYGRVFRVMHGLPQEVGVCTPTGPLTTSTDAALLPGCAFIVPCLLRSAVFRLRPCVRRRQRCAAAVRNRQATAGASAVGEAHGS